MGPASGSAKSAPHKQRKGLHPTGFEETLAWDDGLNWFHFRKVGQRYFFLLPEFLYGIAEREGDPPEMRQQAGKNQTRPCAAICGRSGDWVGERHHRSSKPALLEACGPVVNEQGKPNDLRKVIPRPSPFRGRGKPVLGRKNELAPVRPCVRFWGQGRETTPGKPQTGPVEAV